MCPTILKEKWKTSYFEICLLFCPVLKHPKNCRLHFENFLWRYINVFLLEVAQEDPDSTRIRRGKPYKRSPHSEKSCLTRQFLTVDLKMNDGEDAARRRTVVAEYRKKLLQQKELESKVRSGLSKLRPQKWEIPISSSISCFDLTVTNGWIFLDGSHMNLGFCYFDLLLMELVWIWVFFCCF